MSDCLTATNGVDKVRKLQRALYRTSKQEKKEPSEVRDVETSADQSEGIRGHGESHSDGVGQLLPAHQRQPSLPRVAAFRQHPFSQVLDPEK